jgi:hypothetical protein
MALGTHARGAAVPPYADDQLATPEPMPIVNEPDQFATDFFERLKAKTKATQKDKPRAKPTPTKRSKLSLIVDNDKPNPPEKQ